MKLDYDEQLMQYTLVRFREKLEGVAVALEEQAQEVRRELAQLDERAPFEDLLKTASQVLQLVDKGHARLDLDHNLFNVLHDILVSHEALDHTRAEAEAERQRLATPPTDSWDYLQRLAADRTQHITCRIKHGSRWHKGYLTGMRVRDNTRASKSQYVSIFEHSFDTLEVKVGNRFVPFVEAFPLDEWEPPS